MLKYKKKTRIIIIGGGAAGFFAAANIGLNSDSGEREIIILEKSNKILSKVRISGGGRCNVTNATSDISQLLKNYPRGNKELRKVFRKFSVEQTVEWFNEKGVVLKTEPDGRVFPKSNSSQTIVDCLEKACYFSGVKVILHNEVKSIQKEAEIFKVTCNHQTINADIVLVTTGGFPKKNGYHFLKDTGHAITDPIPSLFTFNIEKDAVTELMGLSVNNVMLKIAGTSLQYTGPVLITHWGFSGPAVLKLSAFGATHLNKLNYNTIILINWINAINEEETKHKLKQHIQQKLTAYPHNTNFFNLPERLWNYLLIKSGIEMKKNWSEQTGKSVNKLVSLLFSDCYTINGKTTFKDEFVTCGGISLKEIDFNTMESKLSSGLFFAGEVIDIDGITGGFNFQAAWSTAWVAANTILEKLKK